VAAKSPHTRYSLLTNNYKLIIAPHQTDQQHIHQLCKKIKSKYLLYSEIDESVPQNFDILIIDCIGILSQIYQYGTIAYIGGAFGKGLHNILEAATFGLPVIYGPKYQRFQEAIDLIEHQGGFSIQSQREFNITVSKLLEVDEFREEASKNCTTYINKSIGASEKIFYHIQNQTSK